MLSDEQQQRYVEDEGLRCPYCSTASIRAVGIRVFSGPSSALSGVECKKCGRSWTDVFTLTGIEEPKP